MYAIAAYGVLCLAAGCRSQVQDSRVCVREEGLLFVVQTASAQQTAHTPFHDMLPHLHTIYNDVILLNVLTEV